ncbi:MAG TPA: alkaline phosphatase family protein [Candidatus Angelobacter sp.]|nr:alkaline phosphatase family protein [Candidatus Angelobacter sp.]
MIVSPRMTTLSRRRFLQAGAAGATLAAALPRHLVDALAAPRQCGSLADVEHVVFLIQENRSFDSYFGTYRGVRGYGDPQALRQAGGRPVFQQPGYDAPGFGGHLFPFRMDTVKSTGECTNDITHSWGPQHDAWNGGAMDGFVRAHMADDPKNGAMTMGYYTRDDLPFYHALADAFTICDRYHCSVIGPTDPNRLYTMTGTLDPDGRNGGPHLTTLTNRAPDLFKYTWTTMPEVLQQAGVSWKVYGSLDGNYGDNVLAYFKAYQNPTLAANAFTPLFPGNFEADCAAGTLPSVSWILAPLVQTEHPPAPVTWGEWATWKALSALTSNPAVWAKTALFVTYDENGGFFDHVPPPVAPPGTAGEYLTVSPLPSDASGIAGPIGLGFRVPMIVCSPFTRGGLVCSDVLDHTSMLRLLETRFKVTAPNLSDWRRATVGDMVGAFDFATPADASVPSLPAPSLADQRVLSECIPSAVISEANEASAPTYAVPPNSMPVQEAGRRGRPSGACNDVAASHDDQGQGQGSGGDGAVVTEQSGPGTAASLPMTSGVPGSGTAVLGATAVLAGVGWLGRRKAELARERAEAGGRD